MPVRCSRLFRIVFQPGPQGYEFLKLNTGMTEVLRPSIYGAQHPIYILQAEPTGATCDYMIAGHCCESGDILTPAPGDPELLAPRNLPVARIGDMCVIDGAGAYCAAMSTKHYNLLGGRRGDARRGQAIVPDPQAPVARGSVGQ